MVCVLASGLAIPTEADAWGRRIHEIINRRAALAVPGEAGEFWASMATELGRHASDADDRKGRDRDEPPRHFLDLDALLPYPFEDVPTDRDAWVKRFGRNEADRWGQAPWAIDESWRMVVRALELGDWGAAGAWAADLGHYVADTHQPLHCTKNYDGQTSGNQGVHLRFEVHMMDRHFHEDSIRSMETVATKSNPAASMFEWMRLAYPGVATILAADDVARSVDSDYGDRYLASLWEDTDELAETQVSAAVADLAALLASAWEAAGRPAPPEAVPSFRLVPVAELEAPPAARRGFVLKAALAAGAIVLAGLTLGAN
ncbi:MAG: hypothetical protein KC591_11830 [Gemmatimonadetes bacterium]|nr:hypothetical protein [Gemmatimonadota bacterium]